MNFSTVKTFFTACNLNFHCRKDVQISTPLLFSAQFSAPLPPMLLDLLILIPFLRPPAKTDTHTTAANKNMNVTPPTHTSVCSSHSASDVCVCAFLPVFTHAKLELLQAGCFKIKKKKRKGKQHRVHNAASQCSCSGLLKLQDWRPELAKKKQLTAKRDTLQQRNSSFSLLFRLHISILGSVEGGGMAAAAQGRGAGGLFVERERGEFARSAKLDFSSPSFESSELNFPTACARSLFQLVESAG